MCFRILALSIACVLLTACYSVKSYRGDGQLVDNGFRLTGGRYVVELGEVSFQQKNIYKYEFANLHSRHAFAARIEFDENISQVKNDDSEIKFVLLSEGKELLSVRKKLREWTLSHGMNTDGVSAYIREGEANPPDCVRGTSFHPIKNKAYQLVVEIWPDSKTNIKRGKLQIYDSARSRRCT